MGHLSSMHQFIVLIWTPSLALLLLDDLYSRLVVLKQTQQ